MPTSNDPMGDKFKNLYNSFGKLANSGSLDKLDMKLNQLQSSAATLNQSKALSSVASGVDKLAQSLNKLTSGNGLTTLSSQIKTLTQTVESSFGKLGKTMNLGIDSSGLTALPKILDDVKSRMPDINNEFQQFSSTMDAIIKKADTFGSALKTVLDQDLRNPLTNFENSLTDMFSPHGSLYGAMDDYFSEMSKRLSNLNQQLGTTLQDVNQLKQTQSINITTSGGGGGGNYSSGMTVIPAGSRLNMAFELIAMAAEKAAHRIDQSLGNLNTVAQNAGTPVDQKNYQSLRNSTYSTYRTLNKGGQYSLNDYTSALVAESNAGIRDKSQANGMLSSFMLMSKSGLPLDPSTAQLLTQIYMRNGKNGSKSVNQVVNAILAAKQAGAPNGGADVLSQLGGSSGMLLSLSPGAMTKGASQMASIMGAVGAVAGTQGTSAISGFMQQAANLNNSMTPQEMTQLQQQLGMSQQNILQIAKYASSGNENGLMQVLMSNYNNLSKATGGGVNIGLAAGQLGITPEMIQTLKALNGNQQQYTKIMDSGNTNAIASQQATAVSTTPWFSRMWNHFDSSHFAQGAMGWLQNTHLNAADMTGVALPALYAMFGLKGAHGHSVAGRIAGGVGGLLGHPVSKAKGLLGTGLFKLGGAVHKFSPALGGALQGIGSHINGVQTGSFKAPAMFKGISHQNPLPVYVVNFGSMGGGGGSGLVDEVASDLEGGGGKHFGGKKGRGLSSLFRRGAHAKSGLFGKLFKGGVTVAEDAGKSGLLRGALGKLGILGTVAGIGLEDGPGLARAFKEGGLLKAGGHLADTAWHGFKNSKGGIGTALSWGMTGAQIGSIAGPVGTVIGGAVGGLAGLIGGKNLVKFGEDIVKYGKPAFLKLGKSAKGMFEDATKFGKSTWESVSKFGSKAWKAISGEGKTEFEDFTKYGSDMWTSFGKIGGSVNKTVHDLFHGNFSSLGSDVKGIWSSFAGAASKAFDDAWKIFKDSPLGKTLGGVASKVGNAAKSVWSTVSSWFSGGGPTITSGFGTRVDPINGSVGFHPGVDIAASHGTAFNSPTSGVITGVGSNPTYGNHVVMQGMDGLTRIFGHASNISVQKGQFVGGGQTLGRIGSTGRSTGPHLHYEVRSGSRAINPLGAGGATYPSSISQWLPQMQQASSKYGVPVPILAGVMNQESGGNPNVTSSAGAIGLMQFMPSTAAGFGIDPWNPSQAIMGGAEYLSQLYHQLGSWPLALAGYNAGGGTVAGWVRQYGNNWSSIQPNLSGGYLQTANYVPSILGWINSHGGMNGVPMSGGGTASGGSGSGGTSSDPFAGYYTSTGGIGSAASLAAAVAGASVSNYQAGLAQSIAGMGFAPGSSAATTIEDVVDKLDQIHTQTQQTNAHLASHLAVAKATHSTLKKSTSRASTFE